jgi:hypothetical protein
MPHLAENKAREKKRCKTATYLDADLPFLFIATNYIFLSDFSTVHL